jgi:hypothetical protein
MMEGSKDTFYLLWLPNSGWGVFSETTCPDVGAFPNYIYRKYSFPRAIANENFRKLVEAQQRLNRDGVVPKRDIAEKIFPEI